MKQDACWILRCEHKLLVLTGDDSLFPSRLPADHAGLADALAVGDWQGRPAFAADVAAWPPVPDGEAVSLRQVFEIGGEAAFALAGRAVQLLDWRQQHRYCGRCATPTEAVSGEHAMRCPACGLLAYPRLSPAIMVLVRDGERLLLARSPRFKPGVYSALAGFVEPGETLEQCAAGGIALWLRAVSRWGVARSWLLGMGLSVAVFAWVLTLGQGDWSAFVLVCMLSGAALGADLVLPAAMLNGLVADLGQRGRSEGVYMGWWSFATKLNLALAAGLALPLLGWLGYAPGQQDPQAVQALSLAYGLLPCVLKLGAAVLLYRFFIRQDSP